MQGVKRLVEVFIPALPSRQLSANGGGRSRRNPYAVADGKVELGVEADKAILAAYYPDIPTLTPPVIVTVTLLAKHHARPQDQRYRARDVFNIGGEVSKPIVDAFVKRGIIPDDDYKNVPYGVLHIEHVETLEQEGIWVRIEEMGR